MALKCKNHILQSKRALKLISQTVRRQQLTLSKPSYSSCKKFIMLEKWGQSMDIRFIFKKSNKNICKYVQTREKDPGGRLRSNSYLIISTANSALFEWNRA